MKTTSTASILFGLVRWRILGLCRASGLFKHEEGEGGGGWRTSLSALVFTGEAFRIQEICGETCLSSLPTLQPWFCCSTLVPVSLTTDLLV